jgi:glutathione synthase/RimK-type ligase-like ATP-grasp enzyme
MAFTVRRLSSKRRFPNTLWVVAGSSTTTNERVVDALHQCGIRARHVDPKRLSALARSDDLVLGRLDVRPTLDEVEDGTWELRRVERRGIRVLNPAPSLIACHDKLRTFALLRFGLPQPQTLRVEWDAYCPLPTGSADGDLVGVDLLPPRGGQHVLLELNGAVDFTGEHSFTGQNVFVEVAKFVASSSADVEIDAAQLGG